MPFVMFLDGLLQACQFRQIFVVLQFPLALATGENQLPIPGSFVGFQLAGHHSWLDARERVPELIQILDRELHQNEKTAQPREETAPICFVQTLNKNSVKPW
jgi:hypothetical protein